MERERWVNPDCANASNPFHVCAEYCVQRAHPSKPRIPRPKLAITCQNGEKRNENPGIVVGKRNVDPSCPNASNPFHQCAEYCSLRNPEVKGQRDRKRSVISAKNVLKMEGKQKREEENEYDITSQNVETSNEVQVTVVAKRNVNPSCRNATNPFHECAEYCSPRKPDVKTQSDRRPVLLVAATQHVERENKDQGIIVAERNVDPLCPNASNPFHQCADYCSPRKPGVTRENKEKGSVKNDVKMKGSRMVDPSCANASNPYHVCAEYCFRKRNEMEHAEASKSVVTAHHDKRGGMKAVEREGVHPNCSNASNPFHKCADYCFQKINKLT